MTDLENTGEQNLEAAAPVADEVVDQAVQEDPRTVPLDALEDERGKRQKLEEELRVIKDHVTLMQTQQAKPAPKDEFDGLSDDDVLTVGDFKKALSKKESEYKMNIEEIKMMQRHADYQEVVTKYLPEVLKQNPEIARTLQQTQDYSLAYYLAKNSDSYKSTHKKARKSQEAERIMANTQRSGSLASVGSTSPINQAKRYKEMSDKDFRAEVDRNLGYF